MANLILKNNGGGETSITADNFIGNSSSTTKLLNARTISLSGDASGSASFNGTTNISIPVTVADNSHNHTISNITNLENTLNSKANNNYVSASLGSAGYYRIASTSPSNLGDSIILLIHRFYNTIDNESYVVSVNTTYYQPKIRILSANIKYQVIPYLRVVYGGSNQPTYLDLYYNLNTDNTIFITVLGNSDLNLNSLETATVPSDYSSKLFDLKESYFSSLSLSGDINGSGNAGDVIGTTIGQVALTDGFQTSFRTSIKGDSNSGPFLRVVRSESAISGYTSPYGSGLAWGRGDTHAYIYMNYSGAQVFVGGGSSDKLNWTKQLAFTDSTVAGANYASSAGTASSADYATSAGNATYASYIKDSYNSSNITITYGKSGQSSTSWLASWNGYELGAISPANLSVGYATSAGNADTVDGYHASNFLLNTSSTITGKLTFSSHTWASSADVDNAPLYFGQTIDTITSSTYYKPWFGGSHGITSQGYYNTIVAGLYHTNTAGRAGFYIGASWDHKVADTYYYFSRDGHFVANKLVTSSNYGTSFPSSPYTGEIYFYTG